MGAGDTLISTTNDMHTACLSIPYEKHEREYRAAYTTLHIVFWSAAELGVLVSTLPCQLRKPKIPPPQAHGPLQSKNVRTARDFPPKMFPPNAKFPSGPRNMDCPVPGLTSTRLPHPKYPRCPSLGFRFASDAVRTGPDVCPALHNPFFSVFAYRFCDSDKFHLL